MAEKFVGVDGCPAGWFAVTSDEAGRLTFAVFADIKALWAAHHDAQIILIDMPIGLPEVGQRRADIEARRVLGDRRSSIFPVPTRAALFADTYEQASTVNRHITGMKLSKQTWNIMPKIRELDELLRAESNARNRIAEIHPEVLFWGLTGAPMAHSKKTEEGYAERVRVLTDFNPTVPDLIESALNQTKRADVGRDDIVDAIVATITATIGDFGSLPPRPDTDGHNLPMQILFAHGTKHGNQPRVLGFQNMQVTIPRGREDDARQFYCGTLRFEESTQHDLDNAEGGFWLVAGNDELHVLPVAPEERRSSHIVCTVDDLSEWRTLLTEADITLFDDQITPTYRRFSIRDPFDNRIDLVQNL